MPKVTLNYEFDTITDQEDMQIQLNAGKLHSAAHEFAQWIRNKRKHENNSMIHIDDVSIEFHETFEGLLP